MERETMQSAIIRLNHYCHDDLGNLTGSTGVKHFPQALLGLRNFKTFPMTENLIPDGSMTVEHKLSF